MTSEGNETIENYTPRLLGTYLKSEREKKGLSLKIVAQRTKISTTTLENLENNSFTQLPNKAYLTGFVRSYAKMVGADLAESMKLLDEAYLQENSQEIQLKQLKKLATSEATHHKNQSADNLPLGRIVAGAVIVLVVITVAVFMRTKDQPKPVVEKVEKIEPKQLSEESPLVQQEEQARAEAAQEEEVVQAPAPTLTTQEIINPPTQPSVTQPVAASSTTTTKEEQSTINFRNIVSPLFSYAEMTKEDLDRYLPSNFRVTPAEGEHVIFINATEDDTWITYKTDDQEIRKFVLSKGRTLLIQGKLTRLFLGNVNATKVFYNNRPIDPQSRTGVKSLVFPHEARSNYKLPLFVFPDNGNVLTSEEYLASLENN